MPKTKTLKPSKAKGSVKKKTLVKRSLAKKPSRKQSQKTKKTAPLKKKAGPKKSSPKRAKAKTQKKNLPLPAKNGGFSLKYCEEELKRLLDREKEEKHILKDMKGRVYCDVDNCDYPAVIENHCRIHFFGLFQKIRQKKQILEKDLLTKSYTLLIKEQTPEVFDCLLKDLSSEKNFKMVMKRILNEDLGSSDETEDF